MKKNKMLRLASVLMVLTLLTTSIVGSTFAKYVTKGSASDTARVAKWGVVVTAGGSLFGKNYKTGAESVPTTVETTTELSVKSNGTSAEKVVAPGTKSDTGLTFGITGMPEVRTKVKVDVTAQDIYLGAGTYAVMQPVTVNETTFTAKVASGLYTKDETTGAYTIVTATTMTAGTTYYELSNQVTLAAAYYPVTYAATGSDATLSGKTKVTEIAKAIADKVKGSEVNDTNTASTAKAAFTAEQEYAPNTNLATELKLDNNTITWAWAFGETEGISENDKKDTILGDLMAGSPVVAVADGGAVTVLTVEEGLVKNNGTEVGSVVTALDITITATQVD